MTIKEHLLSLEELSQKLNTNTEKGITESEAQIRYNRDGPNEFTRPKETSKIVLYFRELTTGFAIIMWLAALGSLICYFIEWVTTDVSPFQFTIDLVQINDS